MKSADEVESCFKFIDQLLRYDLHVICVYFSYKFEFNCICTTFLLKNGQMLRLVQTIALKVVRNLS